jgi:hypothetical protein
MRWVADLGNFMGFQVAWFACVLGTAAGELGFVITIASVALVAHVVAVRSERVREVALIALVVALGSLVTGFNISVGAVTFGAAPIAYLGVPVFIVFLWALFATLLGHSLAWLQGRPLVAALSGLVGSPLSYRGAEALGAVQVHDDIVRGPLVLGLTWAVVVPLVSELSRALVSRRSDQREAASEVAS